MKTAAKIGLLVAVAYLATMVLAAVGSGVIMVLLEPVGCNAMSQALLVLWATIAGEFLLSVAVVGLVVFRLALASGVRLAVLAAYAGALLATYVVVALGSMVAFNC